MTRALIGSFQGRGPYPVSYPLERVVGVAPVRDLEGGPFHLEIVVSVGPRELVLLTRGGVPSLEAALRLIDLLWSSKSPVFYLDNGLPLRGEGTPPRSPVMVGS